MIPKRKDLVTLRQKPNEPFREYVCRWHTLATQVKDRPSNEESIEIIIKGAQPTTGALLCLQSITSFASLIPAGARVESSLRSGNFPTLSAFANQATASNNSSNKGNNDSNARYHKKPTVACIDSPAEPAFAAS